MSLALIVSASTDEASWKPVRAALATAGFGVVVFEADRVATGEQHFTYALTGNTATATVGARSFALDDIRVAWWRKPHWLWVSRSDPLRKRSLENEINRVQQALWAPLRPSVWLNDPVSLRSATSLSRQMAAATGASLITPETMVSNSWSDIRAFAAGRPVAFKALGGHIEGQGEVARTLFTQRLTTRDLDGLDGGSLPYPGVVQAFADKAREWRVTVVGDRIFSAAIYTEGEARMDWRRDQRTDRVRFAAEELPPDIAVRCQATTVALGLRYAAIDLVEQSNGDFVFLEANPNGQFLWLEEELGLPITAAIAEVLEGIARQPQSADTGM